MNLLLISNCDYLLAPSNFHLNRLMSIFEHFQQSLLTLYHRMNLLLMSKSEYFLAASNLHLNLLMYIYNHH
ncbi:MAG: hypothetical protein EBT70_16050 [Betaproteobacteria bacterium]|nr:hypothetical protein [Betaproteobacteria bacterium]